MGCQPLLCTPVVGSDTTAPTADSTSKSQTSGNFCDMRKAILILPQETVSSCPFELKTEEMEGNHYNTQFWDYFRMPK